MGTVLLLGLGSKVPHRGTTLVPPGDFGTREQRIQAKGRQILALLPRRTVADRFTARYWQDRLLGLSMYSEESSRALFELVGRAPDISNPFELKMERRMIFGGAGIPLHPVVWFGIHALPAALFYPAYRATVSSMAKRFIAGNTLPEALININRLQVLGLGFTLDVLGESVKSEGAAVGNIKQYEKNIAFLSEALKAAGIQPNFSLKLTGISPDVSAGNMEGVKANLRRVLDAVVAAHAFLRLDMEYYRMKDLTFRTFREVVGEEPFAGYEDIGIVLQAYLKDAEEDARKLITWAKERKDKFGVRTAVRLVKGAYPEHEKREAARLGVPSPVWDTKPETDACFERVAEMFLQAIRDHQCIKLAVGSHNPRSVAAVAAIAEEFGIPPELLEFQFLYGMEYPLYVPLVGLGYKVRVYTPVGDLETGLPYYVRRLEENTSNASMLVMMQRYLAGRMSADEILAPPQFST